MESIAAWRELRAYRTGRIYAIDGNAYVNRPGPRLIDTAELFASALFDERFGAALEDVRALRRLERGIATVP
jgi:iron complex transport system substrate-binding protein